MLEPPTAFKEEDVKEKFWVDEPFDKYLPKPGFLTDFVLATRGIETPTILSFWSGVWALSSALKRDAYFKWYPDPLYPNFFIVLVAPPRICAKSTAVRQFGEKVLIDFPKFYKDPRVQFAKEVNLLRTKVTPEALEVALVPKENVVIKHEGKNYFASKGSEVSVVVAELATFLGKQKYNTGLINTLVDLYDCKDIDSRDTVGRGHVEFRDIFFTLIGATTIKGINESIPAEAMGGGFLSRLILVHSPRPTRSYPEPKEVIGGPTRKDLAQRLAWIANNAQGEFYFSDEAQEYYNKFYERHRKLLMTGHDSEVDLKSRYDIHLRKLALILKAQRYEEGREISLEILKEAETILDVTYEGASGITQEVGMSSYNVCYNKTKEIIKSRGKITRRQLIQRLSPYGFSAELVLKIMQHIYQEGLIEVSLRGKRKTQVSTKGEELYIWDK